MKILKTGLIRGRHNMPVEKYVFNDTIKDVTAVDSLEAIALQAVEGYDAVELYATGLTVALISVVNACIKLNIKLTLYHYNNVSGSYYKQVVYTC